MLSRWRQLEKEYPWIPAALQIGIAAVIVALLLAALGLW
jgi:hypothetical protein